MKNSVICQLNVSDNLLKEDNLANLDSHFLKVSVEQAGNLEWASQYHFLRNPLKNLHFSV